MLSYHSQPTFSLLYKQELKSVFNSETDYSLLEGTVVQAFDIGFNDRVNYSVKAGSFLSNKESFFADYRHFNISKPTVMFSGKWYNP